MISSKNYAAIHTANLFCVDLVGNHLPLDKNERKPKTIKLYRFFGWLWARCNCFPKMCVHMYVCCLSIPTWTKLDMLKSSLYARNGGYRESALNLGRHTLWVICAGLKYGWSEFVWTHLPSWLYGRKTMKLASQGIINSLELKDSCIYEWKLRPALRLAWKVRQYFCGLLVV